MAWDSIVGQQHARALLRTLRESGRMPHALLFHGPEGVGKEAVAIELARALNCGEGGWDACGRCTSCRAMETLQHPRFKLVFAMPGRQEKAADSAIARFSEADMEEMREQIALKAANPYHRIAMGRAAEIKVSSIRDIRREAAFRTTAKGPTVILICEADRMNAEASNALLKTLEEPPPGMLLILSSSRHDKLLPTITSRCQQVRFEPLLEKDIAAAIRRASDAPPDRIAIAARLAGGNFAAALAFATEDEEFEREMIAAYLRIVVKCDPDKLIPFLEKLAKLDRRVIVSFLTGVQSWFRDALAAAEGTPGSILNVDLREAIEKFAVFAPNVRYYESIETVESAIEMIQKNVHVMTALISCSQRLRTCILAPVPQ